MSYSIESQKKLLSIAKQSIEHGLQKGQPIDLSQIITNLPDELKQPKGTFVTLEKNQQLRGCIGSLQAVRPLAEDIAMNAFNAAFRDPRFPPLLMDELVDEVLELRIAISALTTPERMDNCQTLDSFMAQLEPNRDGIILSDGFKRATFLPSVWKQLPDKEQFIRYLMQKAGMTKWSENMLCERYYSHSFEKDWLNIEA